jgi:hypothetical protein
MLCQRPDRKSDPCSDWLATCGGGVQSLFDGNVAGSGSALFQPAPGFPSGPQSHVVSFHLLEAKSDLSKLSLSQNDTGVPSPMDTLMIITSFEIAV